MSHIARTVDFLSQPLAFYGWLALGLGLCLYLFITLKAGMSALTRRRLEDQQQVQELSTALGEARLEMQTLASDLREVEQQTGMLTAPAPARSGLNLSKRTQVLRRHRAGEDAAKIAATLGLPRGEVDLLVKVQGMLLQQIH